METQCSSLLHLCRSRPLPSRLPPQDPLIRPRRTKSPNPLKCNHSPLQLGMPQSTKTTSLPLTSISPTHPSNTLHKEVMRTAALGVLIITTETTKRAPDTEREEIAIEIGGSRSCTREVLPHSLVMWLCSPGRIRPPPPPLCSNVQLDCCKAGISSSFLISYVSNLGKSLLST